MVSDAYSDFSKFIVKPYNRLTILYDRSYAVRAWFGFKFEHEYYSYNIMAPLYKGFELNYTLIYQLHGSFEPHYHNDTNSKTRFIE